AAGPRGGDPDQAAVLVGEGEEVQAVAFVFPRVVRPAVATGASAGGDEGAVDQHDLPATLRDLAQGAVQARGLRGEQGDHLVTPTRWAPGTPLTRGPTRHPTLG